MIKEILSKLKENKMATALLAAGIALIVLTKGLFIYSGLAMVASATNSFVDDTDVVACRRKHVINTCIMAFASVARITFWMAAGVNWIFVALAVMGAVNDIRACADACNEYRNMFSMEY